MGKAGNCIKMLQILNTGRLYKISELADLLDTNPRNIIEYKKELDEISVNSGFFIETVPGRYGGYRLNGNVVIPSLKLITEEKEILLDAYNFLLTKKDFIKQKEIIYIFSKILSNVEIEKKNKTIISSDAYQLVMIDEEIKKRYVFLDKAIKEKKSIEIEYNSLKNGKNIHILDPYQLFIHNHAWFFLAWDHDSAEVRYFKLNRIENFRKLDKKFTVYKYFKPEDYITETGLKYNGDFHHLVFIAKGTRAMMIKERKYGNNQVITELNDGTIKVELDMQNEEMIVSFALQGKSEIEILEPKWLIERIKKEIEEISKYY
jgi:predicted DNA-binding transcriptional regulator YafY